MYIFSPFFAGYFLYLLGRPPSSEKRQSDKRIISSLIAESGNNCTLEVSRKKWDTEDTAKKFEQRRVVLKLKRPPGKKDGDFGGRGA